ncbi:MAG: [protein-PII] uridylyltransferase [Calditerrivibrio sp.]|nr:[protein-PII] uridylyltransferase [Calditerrivibrio sp.]
MSKKLWAHMKILELKSFYWDEWNKIKKDHFENNTSAWNTLERISLLSDDVIKRALSQYCVDWDGVAFIALGGYARKEMCPFSDIDVLIFHINHLTAEQEEAIKHFISSMWDIGLAPGVQIKNVSELSEPSYLDEIVKNSLIDNRFLDGSFVAYLKFEKIVHNYILNRGRYNFLINKINDVRKRMRKHRDSMLKIEPNIKDGIGGVRDYNSVYWINKVLFESDRLTTLINEKIISADDYDIFYQSVEFIFRIRIRLHYFYNRKNDILNMESQKNIAESMGYTDTTYSLGVELFLRDFYRSVRAISDITHKVFEKIFNNYVISNNIKKVHMEELGFGLVKYENMITIKDKEIFIKYPTLFIHLYTIAAKNGLRISDATSQLIKEHLYLIDEQYLKKHGYLFLKAISDFPNSFKVTSNMLRDGVLERFIPEFSDIYCKAQFNTYHHYTVDEHTLLALKYLDELSEIFTNRYSIFQKVFAEIEKKELLSLAVLLHDIGKGQGKNHSQVGAKMSKIVCSRLDLKLDDIDTVANLVEHHLLMAHISQRRDIHDFNVIKHFISFINNIEELKMLFVLTYADSRATGGNNFNEWKKSLLFELYENALRYLESEDMKKEFASIVSSKRERLKERVGANVLMLNMIDSLDDEYIFSNKIKHIVRHLDMAIKLNDNNRKIIHGEIRDDLNCYEITICTFDSIGLLKKVSGVLASFNINILGAQIYTLNRTIAIDKIQVNMSNEGLDYIHEKFPYIEGRIRSVLSGKISVDDLLSKSMGNIYSNKKKIFKVNRKVEFDNITSPIYTIVDVYAEDFVGLLYYILSVFEKLRISVQKAKISTDVNRVVDSFYITDENGNKIEDKQFLYTIREELFKVI